MLNYEEFAEKFKEMISKKLEEFPEKGELSFLKKAKINHEVDGISFRKYESNIAPCIYIQNYYDMYRENGDLEYVVSEAVNLLYEKRNGIQVETPTLTPGSLDGKIIFQLINTERNAKMLSEMPHREVNDLSIVYKGIVETGTDLVGSVLIDNKIAKSLDFTEEQLYAQAYENTRKILKPTVTGMEQMLASMMKARGESEEQIDMMLGMFPEEPFMFVVTNDRGVIGATSILYNDVLDGIADRLDDDLMVLPSSLHEVIVVGANERSVEELKDMVRSVNSTQVPVEDLLSDNVYFYDREARTLSIAGEARSQERDEAEHTRSGR